MYIIIYIHIKSVVKSVHLVAHSPNSSNERRHPPLETESFSQKLSTFVNVQCFHNHSETQNTRGA